MTADDQQDALAAVARDQLAQLPAKRAEDLVWMDPEAAPIGYNAEQLIDALQEAAASGGPDWTAGMGNVRPVVAVTPHGTYEFGVYAADWDPAAERIVVRLRELPKSGAQ